MAKSSSKIAASSKKASKTAASRPASKSAKGAKGAKPQPSRAIAKAAVKAAPRPAIKTAAARPAATVRRPEPKPLPRAVEPEPAYQRPAPPQSVPTNSKPRKNQAGLSPKELEVFRDMLLAKRRELVGDMSSMEREALRSSGGTNLSSLPIHMADMGTDNYEQEFTLGLMEKDRNLLREINNALAKIQDGTYGICEGTGKPIGKARLEAQPWARFSIEYARKMEGIRPR